MEQITIKNNTEFPSKANITTKLLELFDVKSIIGLPDWIFERKYVYFGGEDEPGSPKYRYNVEKDSFEEWIITHSFYNDVSTEIGKNLRSN